MTLFAHILGATSERFRGIDDYVMERPQNAGSLLVSSISDTEPRQMGRALEDGRRLQVVNDARSKCDVGSTPSSLISRVTKVQCTEGQPVCDILDHVPGISINPFGTCSVLSGPCTSATPTPWISPTDVTVDGKITALIETALLPCSVGGIIGVIDAGQSSVYLLETATPAQILLQALAMYPEQFAKQGRFPSSPEGLVAFMAATVIGSKDDTTWNRTNYNCQGFADALARSLLEAGVAADARLIHFMAMDPANSTIVNHAVTEIETADGTRYLIDAQTGVVSPDYSLDENGEIPPEIQNDWILDLSHDRYGGGSADHVVLGGPRGVGDTWTADMTVTNQSQGLNDDRARRRNMDWDTTWNPEPGTAP